ncbi:hypothetical protein IGI04_004306 [Brassica rapa subsp. trilocularis]|uniref:Glycosyl transferase family 1 domain-containing protein n=1 Tax=Brassica rapa subsp. trilocularis TaxID=1813537 RepID=A0ABQ7NAS0_BRACM|nr:hypothetical protein IGI04_004306 [Brassica rapa subsp. trilocularis]
MAHQEEGWPLGLRPVNARIGGLTREPHHQQVSAGSISFSSLHSPSPSSPSSSDLDSQVRFVVGGDGPKHVRLEEVREKHSLQDRVEMLDAVPHSRVRSVLVAGHMFLNSSLTEAFCTAILEAASCGLLTVLPDDMVVLAEPDPEDNMVRAIGKAISILPSINPEEMHNRKLYSWQDVAKRAEIVYDRAMKCSNRSLLERLSRFLSCGAWAGKVLCMVMIIDYLLWRLLQPDDDIEKAPDISFRH